MLGRRILERFDNGEGEELKAFHTAGFLGTEFGPFWVPDPSAAQATVRPPAGMTGARYARRFVAEGFVVLAFDYRGWGESDSKLMSVEPQPKAEPGQELTIKVKPLRGQMDYADQTEDIRAAVSFIVGEPGVDAERVALPTYEVATAVPTVATGVKKGGAWVVSASGGVQFQPWGFATALEEVADVATDRTEALGDRPGTSWWWD